jgi:hypothetical protein
MSKLKVYVHLLLMCSLIATCSYLVTQAVVLLAHPSPAIADAGAVVEGKQ